MKTLGDKIKDTQSLLNEYKEQQKKVYDSVKNAMDKGYYNSTKEKYEQVLCLILGVEYDQYRTKQRFYNFGIDHISQSQNWVKGDNGKSGDWEYHNYCYIYSHEYGSPFGVITKKETLFNSTERYHRKLWGKVVKNETQEERSFKQFQKSLKNPKVLIELLSSYLNFDVTVYQDKSLKIEPHYLILEYSLENEY